MEVEVEKYVPLASGLEWSPLPTIRVSGRICDKQGMPVEGIMVVVFEIEVDETLCQVMTDEDGRWQTGFVPGRYILVATDPQGLLMPGIMHLNLNKAKGGTVAELPTLHLPDCE